MIGLPFHQPPEPPMSSPSSIRTPSSPSVSFVTTTALPLLTKNWSKSTDTTPQSSKAPAYQIVSGVYPYIPNNHKPMPCSRNKHNETSFNGSTPLPSVQVSALPRGHQMKFFCHLAQPYTPSHSQVIATICCHRQRPSQPTMTTSPQTILRRDTTNTHHHTHSHHLCSNSRSETTNWQLLQQSHWPIPNSVKSQGQLHIRAL